MKMDAGLFSFSVQKQRYIVWPVDGGFSFSKISWKYFYFLLNCAGGMLMLMPFGWDASVSSCLFGRLLRLSCEKSSYKQINTRTKKKIKSNGQTENVQSQKYYVSITSMLALRTNAHTYLSLLNRISWKYGANRKQQRQQQNKRAENACPWIDTREEWTKRLWPFNFVEEFRLNSSSENSNKRSSSYEFHTWCTVHCIFHAICICKCVFVYMYVFLRCKFKP